jgi:transcription factor C subunit 3
VQQADRTNELSTREDSVIDFEGFTTRLFEILQKQPSRIMARNDLKSELGFTDKWRWRLLSRAVRKFERIGILKRVKAQSQYDKMHPCVMLLRDPTPEDLKRYYEYRNDIAGDQEDRGDADEDVEMETEEKSAPSWTPDRSLHNQIVDVVDKSGTAGISNQVSFAKTNLYAKLLTLISSRVLFGPCLETFFEGPWRPRCNVW